VELAWGLSVEINHLSRERHRLLQEHLEQLKHLLVDLEVAWEGSELAPVRSVRSPQGPQDLALQVLAVVRLAVVLASVPE
jgi:hypothetical protein